MKTFRDAEGREWFISISTDAIKRVIKSPIEYLGEPIKVNILALVDPEDMDLLQKAAAYPPLVADIAYALCKPQCDEKNVTDVDFGKAMRGDVLDNVLELIISETIDFFPPSRRQILRKVMDASQLFATRAKTLTAKILESGELDQEINAILEKEFQKLSPKSPSASQPTNGSDGATNSPES